MRINLIFLVGIILSIAQFQNCAGKDQVSFFEQRKSLSSAPMAEGGGLYDGKPENGYYCRVHDNMPCQAQVYGLQSLVKVDDSGLHLLQDNCTSTANNFRSGDAGVSFTSLAPGFIGLTRGIFKKCDVGANRLPLPPTEMTDAFCTSKQNDVAVIVNKSISSQKMDFTLNFRNTAGVHSATIQSVTKTISSNGNSYFSDTQAFNLTIAQSVSQTSRGLLQVVVDQQSWSLDLDCRQANPDPTVIIEKDMELSPSWIDTQRLAGYWKLNEVSAVQGNTIADSSSFSLSGILETGNDGQIKSDPSIPGGALGFDGVNDRIRISRPLDGHLDFGMRSFSYMAWIRKSGNAGTWDMPFFHGGNTALMAGFNMECGSSNSGCYAGISDGQGLGTSWTIARFAVSSSALIGRWVLLTAVVDRNSNQLRAYLDGVLVSTVAISNIGSVNNNLILSIGAGADSGGMNFPFLGSIDDVSLWDRALADSEILEIFQRLRPKFY